MARRSPADKVADLRKAIAAWQRFSPNRSFHGLTLAQFKQAIQPSFDTRAEVDDLRSRLRLAIQARDRADFRSFRVWQGVVFGILGDADEGEHSGLYAALGYTPRAARRRPRRRKR